jgi:hypothetical protein
MVLVPGGRAPVVPHGARQGLKGGVGSGHPTRGWGSAESEGQGAGGEGRVSGRAVGPAPGWGPAQTGGGDPGGRGSGSTAKWRVFRRGVASTAEGRASRVCGSGTELWPGAARGAESPAERSSGSADLRGGDLAAGWSCIRSW